MAQKQIVTKPGIGSPIGFAEDKPIMASPALQNHLDDLTQRLNENLLGTASWIPSYAVADLPASTDLPDPDESWVIFVSDESTGSNLAVWDTVSQAWRLADRTLVS